MLVLFSQSLQRLQSPMSARMRSRESLATRSFASKREAVLMTGKRGAGGEECTLDLKGAAGWRGHSGREFEAAAVADAAIARAGETSNGESTAATRLR